MTVPEIKNNSESQASNAFADYQAKTMFQIVRSQFMEHRFALIGGTIILFFILLALLAPLITNLTGLDPYSQNMFNRYKPPFTTLPFTSDMIETDLKSFAQKYPALTEDIKNFLKNNKQIDTSIVEFDLAQDEFLIALHGLTKHNKIFTQSLEALDHSGLRKFIKRTKTFHTFHIFGTDELGRDVLIRLIYGARVSIGVGMLVAVSGALIGLLLGSLAGFYGGIVDNILMRLTDSLMSLPLLPVMIVLCAVDMKKIPFMGRLFDPGSESIFKLILVLTVFSWMTVARLVRGNILSIKEKDFFHAAKALGAKDFFIIRVHLVPNVIAPLLVAVTVNVGVSILFEAALSFLGLGIQPPIPSWGNMLLNAIEIVYQAPTLAILPGLMIFFVVISFNFLGDGLQDAVNPQAIRR
ncbi:MAG: ABC transporter permease [Desulfobacteraceae bacterium]|nr:MAG: ABC transporter permease [Desulfobacteraceae bacterium]